MSGICEYVCNVNLNDVLVSNLVLLSIIIGGRQIVSSCGGYQSVIESEPGKKIRVEAVAGIYEYLDEIDRRRQKRRLVAASSAYVRFDAEELKIFASEEMIDGVLIGSSNSNLGKHFECFLITNVVFLS